MSDAAPPAPVAILVTPPTRANGRWGVRVGDRRDQVNPTVAAQVRRCARELGVPEDDLRAALTAAETAPPPPVGGPSGVHGHTSGGETLGPWATLGESVRDVAGRQDTFLRWSPGYAAALDVDLAPGALRFTDTDLAGVLALAGPRPRWSWVTRSGGLRLIYTADDGATPIERAGLAFFLHRAVLAPLERVEQVELLMRTRAPLGRVFEDGGGGLGGLAPAAEDVDPARVAAVLERLGLEMSQRYAHVRCPFEPRPATSDPSRPVVVVTGGVRCYVCGRTAGWADLDRGDVGEAPDPLVDAAAHLAHWGHARWLVAADPHLALATTDLARAAYAGLVRACRPVNADVLEAAEREARVFAPRSDVVYRGPRSWMWAASHRGAVLTPPALASLPAIGGDPLTVAHANSAERLPGYTPVRSVPHVIEAPQLVQAPEGRCVLIPAPLNDADPHPDPDAVLRVALPGVTESWLRALRGIVAAGLLGLELRGASPPVALVTGATGAGKGALLSMAAGVLGPGCAAAVRLDNATAVEESIGDALEGGAYLLFADEVGHTDEGCWHWIRPILRLSRTHTWRRLYVGTVSAEARCAIVLAGATLPPGLCGMPELQRRAALWEVPGDPASAAPWAAGIAATFGVGSAESLRESALGAAVAAAVLREARDLTRNGASWAEVAVATGGAPPAAVDEAAEAVRLTVAALYLAWLDPAADTETRPPRTGWVRALSGPAAAALNNYMDPDAPRGVQHAALAALETAQPVPGVTMIVRRHGAQVWFRARSRFDPRSLDRASRSLFPAPVPR